MLSACSVIDQKIDILLLNASGIQEETSYLQYQQMESADDLDKDGLYKSKKLEEYQESLQKTPEGTVHVSFAQNEFLNVQYYYDKDLSKEILPFNCWMNPGDTIYASEPEIQNQENEYYQFSEFRIQEIDEKGNIKSQLSASLNTSGELFHIPDDLGGTEISVIPLGEYRDRTINLNAVYKNPDGVETTLENGIWYVNGNPHGNGKMEINPMGSYRIVYDYSFYQNDWYYEGSEPESYWENSGDSTITFLTEKNDKDDSDYIVRLHPYGELTILNGGGNQTVVDSLIDGASNIFGNKNTGGTQNYIKLLQMNGITLNNTGNETEINLSKIKTGDEIFIRIPSDMKIIAEGLTLPGSEVKNDAREYRFLIPDTEKMNFRLSIGKRNSNADAVFHDIKINNGTLVLVDGAGIRYHEGSELPAENERVNVIITPAERYCIYGKNIKNNVYQSEMKYSDFANNLESIIVEHPIRPGIIVTLDTDDELGNCVFWSGNEMLTGTVVLREGQDLQFDYLLNSDAGFEIFLTPEEKKEIVNVWSPYAASRELEVNENLQGKTLRCRDYITLQERTVAYDFTDPY